MTDTVPTRVLFALVGLFFLGLGLRQLKTGVAWTSGGSVRGYVPKDAAPLSYWTAVAGNLILGTLVLAVSIFGDFE